MIFGYTWRAMSENLAAKEPPAPVRPSLGELFEESLAALVNTPGVFLRLDQRPAPSPVASFALALAWGGVFFALNLVHVLIATPAVLAPYPAWQVAAVGLLGLGIWAAFFLLGGSFLYGLGRTLGPSGDFDRALVVAALALVAAPIQALCGWVPALWFLPTVLSAWIVACGLHGLFKADAWTARGLCALLAAGALGLQYAGSLAVERYAQAALRASQPGPPAAQFRDLQQQVQQIQALAVPPLAATTAPSAPGASSLDLLRGPGGNEPARAPSNEERRQQLAQMSAQGDAMNKSVAAMLDSMLPMLNNPALTKNMSPQQKADFAELNKIIAEMKDGMTSNAALTPQESRQQMARIQNLMMRMLSAAPAMPKPPAAPPEGKK
jgi:hypothetical protein